MSTDTITLTETKIKLQQTQDMVKATEKVYLDAIRIGLGDSERRKAHQEYLAAKTNLSEVQITVDKLEAEQSGRPAGVTDFDIFELLDKHLEGKVSLIESPYQRAMLKKGRENLLASLSSNRADGGASMRFRELGILLKKEPDDNRLFFAFADAAEGIASQFVKSLDNRRPYPQQRAITANLKAAHDPDIGEQARAEAIELRQQYDEQVEKWTAVTLQNESPAIAVMYREDRAGYLSRKQAGRMALLNK